MKVEKFVEFLNSDFWVGVPDSLLSPLCNYLMDIYGIDSRHHLVAANEGNCVGIAAGYHLATGKIPVVYMQNSGEGNATNPIVSLLNEKVYAIPMIFVIGWRGRPGTKDEPQHVFQGEITEAILNVLGIEYYVLTKEMTEQQLAAVMKSCRKQLENGKSVAFIVEKNALIYDKVNTYENSYKMQREDAIKCIVKFSGTDPIISTTGKASRELFEIREMNKQGHKYDFLTVGSMGHSSSIALGIATQKENCKVWCIDGDGAILMHMGAMAVIGASDLRNFIHVAINNESHESVGGLPTVARNIDLCAIASACGYDYVVQVDNVEALEKELLGIKFNNKLSFIEVKCALGTRENLGRPTMSAVENKVNFMEYILENS